MRTMIRRTRVEVDLSAIISNAKLVRSLVGGAAVFAVVKADGYGHGAIAVAHALAKARAVGGFAVSLVEEGVVLREAGITAPILVLGPSQVAGEDEMIAQGLTPVIGSEEDLGALVAVARRRIDQHPGGIDAHLKLDTGMGRLGVAIERAPELAVIAARNGVRLVGAMTHFACADSDDPADPASMTRQQLARFRDASATLVAAGAPITIRHTANSSGALWFPEARQDLVRVGIAVYGNGRWPHGATPRQAMRLVTEVAQLRHVEIGASVGYGATWSATRRSLLAVLPLGYADGLPRRASGHAEVAIRGKRAPLVGLISMDIAIADVTDVPGVEVGDPVVLLGRASDGASITTAEYAAWSGLSEYEVMCGMSKRVPRTYMSEP
ncbi:MAG: alanine racemase [Proteobacteria bacterium]|nr:alanine racemase [Pseudomonadota bacterium]